MKKIIFVLAAILLTTSCIVSFNPILLKNETRDIFVQSGTELSFQNTNGDIEVAEWEADYVQIETFIYGDSTRGIPEDFRVQFEEQEHGLSVVVDLPINSPVSSVDFTVKIPRSMDCSVDHDTVNGDTRIVGDFIVKVKSVNGDVFVEAASSTGLKTVNGDISAQLFSQDTPLKITSVNGDILVELSKSLDIIAETVNGDVVVGANEFTSGEARIEGAGQTTVTVETVNGDIEVTRVKGW